MTVYKKDLIDLTLNPKKRKRFLYCTNCESRFSASRGDYFSLPENYKFTCGECGSKDIIQAFEITIILEAEE